MNKELATSLTRLAVGVIFVGLLVGVAALNAPPRSNHLPTRSTPPVDSPRREASFQFPAGGRKLSPDYRFVALYGTPNYPALGSLGEQPAEASVARVKELSAQYQPLSKEHIYPTFEVIASVAAAGPTENGDYSEERPIEELRPLVELAKKEGIYVVLDLQPGRTDFLTQAKSFEPLLREPHVGLALDPEWRLGPTELHLVQIGHVGIGEVNATSQWLADLTKRYQLPQKLFLLHQFRLDMIENREGLDTSRSELDYLIHVDGHGTQETKQETWAVLTAAPPPNTLFGWKNFYDEDTPMRSPQDTMNLQPVPHYVSFQ